MDHLKGFKTLLIDIETSPNLGYFWKCGKNILGPDSIVQERKIICICYKWLHETKVHELRWSKRQSDYNMLKKITKIIHSADEVVAHNGDKFDIKYINGRLAHHNLMPLGPITSTDTLKQSRKTFYLNSHKLDYLGKVFKLGKKLATKGFSMWKDVMSGSQSALNDMVKYCRQDVLLLEKVYKHVLKYSPNIHKGRIVRKLRTSCPNCGNLNSVIGHGKYCTKAGGKQHRFMCHNCGTIFKVPL